MQIIKYTAGAVAVVIAIDMLGFVAWIASGQYPLDGFYLGAVTAKVLELLIN